MKPILRRARGATLIVVLVMLIVLTLVGLSAINISSSNLKIVGNMQAKKNAEAVAWQASEFVMNSLSYFSNPTAAVPYVWPTGMTTSTISDRVCLFNAPATGYSAVIALAPEDNHWRYQVTVRDTLTNALVTIDQGAKVRMLAGNCPAPPAAVL